MLRSQAILLILVSIAGLTASSCGSGWFGNTSNVNKGIAVERTRDIEAAKDNPEELGTLVTLPVKLEDVAWREQTVTAPDGRDRKRLLATFQLLPEESQAMVEAAEKHGPGQDRRIPTEDWFPPELTTQSEMSADEGITVRSYPAKDFYSSKYAEGTISRVGNSDFFVLELFSDAVSDN